MDDPLAHPADAVKPGDGAAGVREDQTWSIPIGAMASKSMLVRLLTSKVAGALM